jgi:forkhead box protein L
MFENGNYRRRRRMKRPYRPPPYAKGLFGDAYHPHGLHPGVHPGVHHQLSMGGLGQGLGQGLQHSLSTTRNLFSPPSYPTSYSRYDPR